MKNQYEYIIETEQLIDLCNDIIENTNIIAIDTEFMRKNTYYPILCLIQVGYYDKKTNEIKKFIIDPLYENIKLDIFCKEILNNEKIKKIIHCFGQDLEALAIIKNFEIKNVDDTQLMAEFCYCNANLSYSHLAEEILDIEFKKNVSTQKSNWLKRPLSDKQKIYAINDVAFLIPMYKVLLEKLKYSGNYDYYLSEIRHQIDNKNESYLIKTSWKKLKFDFDKKSINYVLLLKELCEWREKKAIQLNIARFSVMENIVLEMIAKFKPKTLNKFKEMFSYSGYNFNISRENKKEIIDIITTFDKNYNLEYDEISYYTREHSFIYKDLLEKISKEVKNIAETHKISLNLAINKMDIIALIMKYENKEYILYGWKKEVFGKIFENY